MALNDKQLALAKLLGRIADCPTKEAAAVQCGYSAKYVFQLQHNEEWRAVRDTERDKNLSTLLYEADCALARKVRDGDVRAIDLAYKRCGVIQSGSNQVVNVNQTNAESFGERLERGIAGRNRITENTG